MATQQEKDKKTQEQKELDDLIEKLWTFALDSKWPEVTSLYKTDPRAHTAELTRMGDTALHMAIDEGREGAAVELVKLVETEKLGFRNKLGNTALHLAAVQGSARVCRKIGGQAHATTLMGVRNNADETPLYVAAKHGRREAFICMHGLCTTDEQQKLRNRKYSRRDKDGRTILHAAITGEHFDLAYQIIHLYPHLKNRKDKRGFLPLHLLARMPHVFKSGCPMGLLHKLTYFCINVKQLKFIGEYKTKKFLGPNLQRLMRGPRVTKTDAEAQQNDDQQDTYTYVEGQSGKRSRCLTLVSKGIGAILWLGKIQIGNIIEDKKKHTWSVQIMEKLLEKRSKREGYGDPSSQKKDAQTPDYDDASADIGRSLRFKISLVNLRLDKNVVGPEVVDQQDPKYGNVAKGPALKQSITEVVEKIIEDSGVTVDIVQNEKKEKSGGGKGNVLEETPLLVAARNGILEMVEKILEKVPAAIHDVNVDNKNIVLLAVENRQPHIYQFLLDQKMFFKETIFYRTDKDGNSALHLAAVLSDERNWNIPGPALHMQWEIKWYQFVENSMQPKFFVKYNEKGETAWDIFRSTHTDLVCNAGKWLSETSNSCSVVSILIATVAFAAYATVPGGINSNTGTPILERETIFHVFAISSLIALCFSISSVVMFLVFFTSRNREKDYATNLPTKLLVELSSLMIAVAALLVAFCAAHSFVIKDSLKFTAFPLYAATLLPVVVYAFWQVPMYFQLGYATFQKTPQRIYSYN